MANYIPKIGYDTGPTYVTFTLPPEGDPYNEVATAANVTTVAASGVIQNNQLYQEQVYKLKFTFVTKTVADAFRTFFENWGSLKKEFTYYPHTDTTDGSGTYTLVDDKINFERTLPGASSDFLYDLEFSIRALK